MVTRERAADRRYGLGKSLAPVVAELSRRGWRASYFCQDDLPAASIDRRGRWISSLDRWPVLRSRPALRQLMAAWLERLDMGCHAAALAQSEAYSHVHVHDPWIGLGFWIGAWRRGLSGVRWGVTEHGFGSYGEATRADGLEQGPWTQRLLCWIERRVLAAADWVIAPTRLALDEVARDVRVSPCPEHWHVVPHAGPDWVLPDRTAARLELGWTDDDICILGVGRLVPLKRFDLLLEIFLSLAPRYSALRLCLLGEGELAADFGWRAREAGFSERLLIVGTDDVGKYLAASDIYVSLSVSESFGLANLEAVSAGLPSVCTRVGGVPEVLADGAWLVEQTDDGRAAAAVVELLLDSSELRRYWSLRAIAHAANWPTVQMIGDAYVAIYQP